MASSYISTDQKSFINDAFDNIHETFARTVSIIMNPEVTIISTSPTYNALYDADTNSAVNAPTYTPVAYSVKARIKYLNQDKDLFSGTDSQQKVLYPVGSVKIKVDATGYNYLKEARKIEFDGRRYGIASDRKTYGMFGPKYYSFILTPINE
jgi:hypothetical protein